MLIFSPFSLADNMATTTRLDHIVGRMSSINWICFQLAIFDNVRGINIPPYQ